MIVIESIKFFEENRDPIEIINATMSHESVWVDGDQRPIEPEIFKELVRGRRFRRPSDGTDVVIGNSKQAQDVLGLQYEAWKTMENGLTNLRHMYHTEVRQRKELESQLNNIKHASFWQRLKFLFQGWKE